MIKIPCNQIGMYHKWKYSDKNDSYRCVRCDKELKHIHDTKEYEVWLDRLWKELV